MVSFFVLLLAVLQQVTPLTLKVIVDEITQQLQTGDGSLQRLSFWLGIIFVINVLSIILNAVNQRIGDYLASRLGKYLTEYYYRKIFTLPQKYFDSELSGKMVNQLTRGIVSIQEFIGAASNFILPAFLQSFFTIGVLFYFAPWIGALAAAIFPIYVAVSRYSTKKWGERQVLKNELEDEGRGRIQEVIGNIKLVKTFNTQPMEWKFVSEIYRKHIAIYDRQSTVYHILNFIREFAFEITLISIFILVFRGTFAGVYTLGELVLILQLLNQLRRPLYSMSFVLERIQRAEADSKAFFEVIELESSEAFAPKVSASKVKHPSLQFQDVTFQYESGDPVLKNVNLELNKKETIALVGHSGAGKTTLINLILKLYDPTSGEILLSDKKYADMTHQEVRSYLSLVFQDNELFSSTVRENVAYGMEKAKEKDIVSALKKANAYDFVMKLPSGLDAKIGERGVKLSGGQKQRLQIARAIMHDAPILILDEATSSLDSKSEKLVQDALENLMKDRLVIIIAHRFSTIQNVDRILVIDEGSIVDSGTPQELAQRKGVYSELLRYQVEGNKKLLSKYELV
ncbi:ABC transporter ATP-binding protein/permease [Candidatus Woesebacteria bacterium]|nr:ABC transporter ATP-binding protein/permease [Candidatus Woesebacteria bacterium]